MTPLHVATEIGHLKVVQYLVDCSKEDMDMSIHDHYGVGICDYTNNRLVIRI